MPLDTHYGQGEGEVGGMSSAKFAGRELHGPLERLYGERGPCRKAGALQ